MGACDRDLDLSRTKVATEISHSTRDSKDSHSKDSGLDLSLQFGTREQGAQIYPDSAVFTNLWVWINLGSHVGLKLNAKSNKPSAEPAFAIITIYNKIIMPKS